MFFTSVGFAFSLLVALAQGQLLTGSSVVDGSQRFCSSCTASLRCRRRRFRRGLRRDAGHRARLAAPASGGFREISGMFVAWTQRCKGETGSQTCSGKPRFAAWQAAVARGSPASRAKAGAEGLKSSQRLNMQDGIHCEETGCISH